MTDRLQPSTGGEQIPEDLQEMYHFAQEWRREFGSERRYGAGTVEMLIERSAKAEASLAQKTRECEELAKLLNLNESGVSAVMAAIEGKREAEAQVEQLQRQVAERDEALSIAAKECLNPEGTYGEALKRVKLIEKWLLEASSEVASRARTK